MGGILLSFTLAAAPVPAAAPEVDQAERCRVAMLHARRLLGGRWLAMPAFVAMEEPVYTGKLGYWWINTGRRGEAAPADLIDQVRASPQPSALSACPQIQPVIGAARAPYFSDRASAEASARSMQYKAMFAISLPVLSADGQSAALLESYVELPRGGSGHICHYRKNQDGGWQFAGCARTWGRD